MTSLTQTLLPHNRIYSLLQDLSSHERRFLWHHWPLWARDNQRPPQDKSSKNPWRVWAILAGRGFGKTRTGAEWIRDLVWHKGVKRIGLIGPTFCDVRDVMIEGESGLMAISPPWEKPKWESSKRKLTWPNGAQALALSAEEPDRLRGLQYEAVWCDELASWRQKTAWDMMMFGLRLGGNPRALITTTPKPLPWLKKILASSQTHVTRGSSYDNQANLPAVFFDQILKAYEGTQLGRQEIYADFIETEQGCLWSWPVIEKCRSAKPSSFKRVIIAVDPAITATAKSDETGIMVMGQGADGITYVIEDGSLKGGPSLWGARVIELYHKHKADRVVAEVNQGGDLVESLLRSHDRHVSYKSVRATRGKYIRAEPVAALYEQSKVRHIGIFKNLEQQLCTWQPGRASPDRLDALVWGVTYLMLGVKDIGIKHPWVL